MPELPEVETVRRRLAQRLPGLVVGDVQVGDTSVSLQGAAELRSLLVGRRIVGVRRRGKYLIVDFEGVVAVIHLRMTGQVLFAADPGAIAEGAEPRFSWRLEPGATLWFRDVRRFGRLWAFDPAAEPEFFARLGPEPFDEVRFTVDYLRAELAGRSAPLKSFLLDQRRLAGVGNIYADEALFRARLHPLRPAGSIGPREAKRLYTALKETLQAGIDHAGSSIATFVDPAGENGTFQGFLNVYQRAGAPCRICGTPIRRVVVGGRGTHFCPRCQRARGRGPRRS